MTKGREAHSLPIYSSQHAMWWKACLGVCSITTHPDKCSQTRVAAVFSRCASQVGPYKCVGLVVIVHVPFHPYELVTSIKYKLLHTFFY